MAEKVEVVIKIPKYYLTHPQDYSCLAECVRRGTPLPKRHGRLIDADELKKHKYHDNDRFENAVAVAQIDWAPTIIEADKLAIEDAIIKEAEEYEADLDNCN